MNGFTRKVLRSVGLALVVAMLVAPAALGSPGNGLDRWAANAIRESGAYGSLDSWAYNAIHRVTPIELVTEHSAGQNATVRPVAAAVRLTVVGNGRTGFSFRDAGIGAATAVAAMLVLLSSLVVRRRRVAQAL